MFNWASFLTYVVATVSTPGPNTISSMSNASRLGLRRALPYNFGIWLGFSVVSSACAVFCSTLSAFLPKLRFPMLIVGALYMLRLAWKTWRSDGSIAERDARGGFLAGLTLQFVNPKIYLYCIMSMEAYILPYCQGQWGRLLLFALLLAFIGFLFTLLWAVFGSVFRLLFSRYARITNTVMALLLVYCAVSLFFT